MKFILGTIAIAIVGATATAKAETFTTRVNCVDHTTFNYGRMEVSTSDQNVKIKMSSSLLSYLLRQLTGVTKGQTRSMELTLPLNACAISNAGSKIPMRCYVTSGAELDLTDWNGNVTKLTPSFVLLENLVRLDETVNSDTGVKRVVNDLRIDVGQGPTLRTVNAATSFLFGECTVAQ